MKAYFDILGSSFQSSLKQVFIAPSSKAQNVNAGSHCNFMIFQWKPDLTFGKWSKICNNGHTKQAPVAKNAKKYPQNGPNSSFKAWKWVSIFYPFCVTTLVCICGTLVPKTKLKCTKNFKALYLSLTKSNGTVFWCFGTDMSNQPGYLIKIACKISCSKLTEIGRKKAIEIIHFLPILCKGWIFSYYCLGRFTFRRRVLWIPFQQKY